MDELTQLRNQIIKIDHEIFELISNRVNIAKLIGRYKLNKGIPIRNFQIENKVIKRANKIAKKFGISKETAEEIARLLITEAVSVQEEFHNITVELESNADKKCLIVGGAGKMGTWLVEFLRSSGHIVEIVDPILPIDRGIYHNLPKYLDDFDVIAISTPLNTIPDILENIVKYRPKGLIFDIGSLKSKISDIISDQVKTGMKITSCHPMFGPDVKTLRGRNLIICNSGSNAADDELKQLFIDTAVNIIEVDIQKHDKYMSFSLGLAHAINLVFGDILLNSGIKYNELMNFAGTTFIKQITTTQEVFDENPELYYWIQHLNKHKDELYHSFNKSVEKLKKLASLSSPSAFNELMNSGNTYFHGANVS